MSEDALKSLLAAEASPPPAHDVAFSVEVMARVARRRLIDGIVTLVIGIIAVSALLYLVMPYITPAIIRMAEPLLPVAGILAALAVIAYSWDQMRPALRRYGLKV